MMLSPRDYKPVLPHFAHQEATFLHSADMEAYGLFWEQGTGKTKTIIDTFAYLAMNGRVDTLLVIAPNGVHRNWITDEIPAHLGPEFEGRTRLFFWESRRSKTKGHQLSAHKSLSHNGPLVVTMNYDAMMTKAGETFIRKLFSSKRILLVFDESHYLKTPGAKRTKRAIAMARKADYRRVLTGTPIANAPFDAYSQLKCLDEDFWKQHRFPNFTIFKGYFGIFIKGHNSQQGRDFEQCVGYRNLDELKAAMEPITNRVTKDEALDLPPKLYQKRYFDLTADQERIYKEIKNEAIALLESGDTITAPLAITRLLRMQQVTCGYVPTDEGGCELFYGDNPRMRLLEEVCGDLSSSAIIWARFRHDIDQIMALLGSNAVRYDGSCSDDDRAEAKSRFQAGEVQFFVGNPAAGATGLTLIQARTVIYYSNSFKLTDRLQSEDRAHRIGQRNAVTYIDLIANGTVDAQIVAALRNKLDIASELTGDKLKEWI